METPRSLTLVASETQSQDQVDSSQNGKEPEQQDMISIERFSANCSRQQNHDEVSDLEDETQPHPGDELGSNVDSLSQAEPESLILYKYLYELIYQYAPGLVQ